MESNAVLIKISHCSTDNNGNLTFSTPDEETDLIPTGLLNPILSKKVLDAQNKQKMHQDYPARYRLFDIGGPVFCQNYARGDELLPGHIIPD